MAKQTRLDSVTNPEADFQSLPVGNLAVHNMSTRLRTSNQSILRTLSGDLADGVAESLRRCLRWRATSSSILYMGTRDDLPADGQRRHIST